MPNCLVPHPDPPHHWHPGVVLGKRPSPQMFLDLSCFHELQGLFWPRYKDRYVCQTESKERKRDMKLLENFKPSEI